MPNNLLSLHLLCIFLPALLADPDPSRIPKVYNALITSNQNLEPSKAYPVYQPVLHDATFSFPFQPIYYGANFPFGNAILPPVPPPAHAPAPQPQDPKLAQPSPPLSDAPSTEAAIPSSKPVNDKPPSSPTTPPAHPATESPIPLNEFGLPPQVIPISRIDPSYNGFTHVGPFPYAYPNFRFYDPYDPFGFNLYPNTPLIYGPLTNGIGQNAPESSGRELSPTAASAVSSPTQDNQTPPPEPTNLNILNYSSVDPNIPNVPPPPLPEGGLKTEKIE